jgi:H+/gluconate symporter-like permease
MSLLIVIFALVTLMGVAYRGHSVILFAPLIAMGAVLLTDPSLVAPLFTGLFMDKMVAFLKLFFPVFLLGAIFGKAIELAGFSKAIVAAVTKLLGDRQAISAIVLVCAVLTYGGVSLFVVVFAVYPFAAELFRANNIPKRLIPGAIALGAFTFTMDALPGTPQIQNMIPTTFFKTNAYAAPWLGILGSLFIASLGLAFLEWRRRCARCTGEGYGTDLLNEPIPFRDDVLPHPLIAVIPLVAMAITNKFFSVAIPQAYGQSHSFIPSVMGQAQPVVQEVAKISAVWAVQGALLVGIASVFVLAWRSVIPRFVEGSKSAISGATLAAMNTASEYGFGAVIAALPGFLVVASALESIANPLLHEAITVTSLAGITGSASGGLSIALAAMGTTFVERATAAGIPLEVLHRVAAMASGGMDTLPHNGAVITLLSVCGLTHRTSYLDILAITIIKTLAVLVVIGVFMLTGIV